MFNAAWQENRYLPHNTLGFYEHQKNIELTILYQLPKKDDGQFALFFFLQKQVEWLAISAFSH